MAGRLGHIELPAQDDERGKRFWGSLFGWEFQDAGIPEMRYHLTQIGDVGGAVFASESAGSFCFTSGCSATSVLVASAPMRRPFASSWILSRPIRVTRSHWHACWP